MHFTQTYFFLILLAIIGVTVSFRCARLCAFIGIPINNTISVNACDTTNQTILQCSVTMEMNHDKRTAKGQLGLEKCTNTTLFRTETAVKLNSTLVSAFRYTCTEDDCDSKFLSELFTRANDIPPVNTLMIQQHVTDLIYNVTLDTDIINCTNASWCSGRELCQVKFQINNTSNGTIFELIQKSTCIAPSKDDYLLNIKQNYEYNSTLAAEMIFRCNIEHCIDESIAKDIYTWIHNEKFIPEFDSYELDSNKTCPLDKSAGTLLPIPFNVFIIFGTIFLLSYQ